MFYFWISEARGIVYSVASRGNVVDVGSRDNLVDVGSRDNVVDVGSRDNRVDGTPGGRALPTLPLDLFWSSTARVVPVVRLSG